MYKTCRGFPIFIGLDNSYRHGAAAGEGRCAKCEHGKTNLKKEYKTSRRSGGVKRQEKEKEGMNTPLGSPIAETKPLTNPCLNTQTHLGSPIAETKPAVRTTFYAHELHVA